MRSVYLNLFTPLARALRLQVCQSLDRNSGVGFRNWKRLKIFVFFRFFTPGMSGRCNHVVIKESAKREAAGGFISRDSAGRPGRREPGVRSAGRTKALDSRPLLQTTGKGRQEIIAGHAEAFRAPCARPRGPQARERQRHRPSRGLEAREASTRAQDSAAQGGASPAQPAAPALPPTRELPRNRSPQQGEALRPTATR